jgi:hypothetical protein
MNLKTVAIGNSASSRIGRGTALRLPRYLSVAVRVARDKEKFRGAQPRLGLLGPRPCSTYFTCTKHEQRKQSLIGSSNDLG